MPVDTREVITERRSGPRRVLEGKAAALAGFLALGCVPESSTPPPSAGGGCRFLGTDEGTTVTPAAPDGSCLVVATINPLSGALGPVGLALENAARLAVRDVNGAGGVVGKKLCLVSCDDRTDPTTAAELAEEVNRTYSPLAVNGGAASAVTLELATVFGPRGIAQVSCCSTSPALTDQPSIYRTVPSDALQGVVLASVARNLPEPATDVAIIHIGDTYGQSLANVFEQSFVALGGTVRTKIAYAPGEASYVDVISQALYDAPSYALLIAFPTDGAQVMRDWRDSGVAPRVRWLATDGLRDDKFVQGAGGLASGVIGTAPRLVGTRYGSFDRRYRAAFGGETPGIFTSNQYDAMMLIALGLARTGGTGGEPLREAIKTAARAPGTPVSADDVGVALRTAASTDVDYSGASGEVEMDDRGDVISDYGVWSVTPSAIEDRAECWACRLEMGVVRCEARAGGC